MLIKSFSHALKPSDIYVAITSSSDTSTLLDTHDLVICIEYLWDLILDFALLVFGRRCVLLNDVHINCLWMWRIIPDCCKYIDIIVLRLFFIFSLNWLLSYTQVLFFMEDRHWLWTPESLIMIRRGSDNWFFIIILLQLVWLCNPSVAYEILHIFLAFL